MGEPQNEKQQAQTSVEVENEEAVKEETKEEVKEEAKDEVSEKKAKKEDKKVAKLEKALKKAEEERDAFKDSYQRTFSEFNNFKKRNATASSQANQNGMCDAIAKILPVIDNFERALEHVDEQQDDAFAQGVSMVYKQLIDILNGMEVKEIPAQDEKFDPNVHQAIQQVDAEEGVEPGTVVTVVQKGYMLADKILRHSMVIVSK